MGIRGAFLKCGFVLASCAVATGPARADDNRVGLPRSNILRLFDTGDLLFTYDPVHATETAAMIARTTQDQFGEGPLLSHVSILERTRDGKAFLIDASDLGVRRRPFDAFVGSSHASNAHYYLAKIEGRWRSRALHAVEDIKAGALGLPYDPSWSLSSPGQSCAKLMYQFFRADSGGTVFQPQPMFFGDPESGARIFWMKYFARLGKSLPEGQPGVSPLSLYLDGLKLRLFSIQRFY